MINKLKKLKNHEKKEGTVCLSFGLFWGIMIFSMGQTLAGALIWTVVFLLFAFYGTVWIHQYFKAKAGINPYRYMRRVK